MIETSWPGGTSKRLIALLQRVLGFEPHRPSARARPPVACPCCGAAMVIVKTRIRPLEPAPPIAEKTVP